MKKKPPVYRGPCECVESVADSRVLSAQAALQSESKCYSPVLVLNAHFRPP